MKRMKVKLRHPGLDIDWIGNLTVDQNYTRRILVSAVGSEGGESKGQKVLGLMCYCKLADDYKNTLTVSSLVSFENFTENKLFIKILASKNSEDDTVLGLDRGLKKPVPFDLVDNDFTVSLDSGKGFTNELNLGRLTQEGSKSKESLRKFYHKEHGYFGSCSFSDSRGDQIFLVFQIERSLKLFQNMNIVFKPAIKIKNCLPWPLKYRFSCPDESISSENSLNLPEDLAWPQEQKEIISIDVKKDTCIQLLIPGFEWSKKFDLIQNSKDIGLENILLQDGQLGN